jgi:hypothetical protein
MFVNNKYLKIYNRLIDRSKSRLISGYTEKHHIIPKSLGGNGRSDNIVILTAREHYICHRLLTKITTGEARQKMFHALICFTKPIQHRPNIIISSRVIAEARLRSSLYLSQIRKGNATRPAGTYRHSEETKSKQSASAVGIVKRPAGYRHDPATIELMKQNRKGKNTGSTPWNKGLVQSCPHCNKIVKGTLNRWHGDRCRFKSSS